MFLRVVLLLMTLLLGDQVVAANISGELSLSTRYFFRGLIQGDDSPAFQGAVDYRWQNGAYVGAWGSWVLGGDQANVEVNYYTGGLMQLNSIIWNAGALYYDYRNIPGNNSRQEVYLIGYWQRFRLSSYWDLEDEQQNYMELYSRWHGPLDGDIILSAGRQSFQENSYATYTDYQLGWERVFGDRWSFTVKYTDTRGREVNPNNITLLFRWFISADENSSSWSKY